MAKRKKRKVVRKAKKAKAKTAAKRMKTSKKTATRKVAPKVKTKKKAAKAKAKPVVAKRKVKRAAPKPVKPPVERMIVDTVEEAAPGVIVVREYEAVVQRTPSGASDDEDDTED